MSTPLSPNESDASGDQETIAQSTMVDEIREQLQTLKNSLKETEIQRDKLQQLVASQVSTAAINGTSTPTTLGAQLSPHTATMWDALHQSSSAPIFSASNFPPPITTIGAPTLPTYTTYHVPTSCTAYSAAYLPAPEHASGHFSLPPPGTALLPPPVDLNSASALDRRFIPGNSHQYIGAPLSSSAYTVNQPFNSWKCRQTGAGTTTSPPTTTVSSTVTFSNLANSHATMRNAETMLPNQMPYFSQPSCAPQYAALPINTTPFYNMSVRKLQELPEFSGLPEQWPMFVVAYQETSAAYNYTNLENLSRLQKALKGVAKQQVEALLIHPNNVDTVMRTLEFNYGRPEMLIRSQIAKARAFPTIAESKSRDIIGLNTMVLNLTAFLESAGAGPHLTNPTLLDELVAKLPQSKREEWAKYTYTNIQSAYPSVRDFSCWLQQVATYVSAAVIGDQLDFMPAIVNDKKSRAFKPSYTINKDINKCIVCKEEHYLYRCAEFQKKSVDERWNIIKENCRCFCCLRQGHQSFKCSMRRKCGISGCQKFHNRLLHATQYSEQTADFKDKQVKPAVVSVVIEELNPETLFKFLPIELIGPKGRCQIMAFIDEGSKISLLEEDVAKSIGLKGASDILSLKWIDKHTTSELSQHLDLEISNIHNTHETFQMKDVRSTKKLLLPPQSLQLKEYRNRYPHLIDIPIDEYDDVVPKLLIGMPHIRLVRPLNVVNLDEGFAAHQTQLGWVFFGSNSATYDNLVCRIDIEDIEQKAIENIERQVAEYFALEDAGVKPAPLVISDADVRAENILKETTKQLGERYETGLLWKSDAILDCDSYTMSLRRLVTLENKMAKNAEFAEWYKAKINEYISKSYAKKLRPSEIASQDGRVWYLPHFCICNPNKGNKRRLVFDAAAAVDNRSLNSMLMKGPAAYQPKLLMSVLFNFRQAKFAVSADIKEMFLRINIREEDQNAQRFLWRNGDSSKPPEVYAMTAMIFGSACSPCSAQYVKNVNASKFREKYPRAVKAIVEHHYVDDYVDSFDTESEAIDVTKAVIAIHDAAGFELRGFASNSGQVLAQIGVPQSNQPTTLTDLCPKESTTEKILGMYWTTPDDMFCFILRFAKVPKEVLNGNRKPTKAEVLSLTMSIFDPIGFHELYRHQNQEAIVCAIRSKFWIIGVRRLVSSAKTHCQLCKNQNAMPKPPLMGQLPIDRLTPFGRAFSYTGVDYFGPVLVAIGRRREKRWVCLFTCLTVRAIHLELAKDLSTDALILCLRNFINRRGVPVRMRSDRGTNFIGVSKQDWVLVENNLAAECASKGVEWIFNTPGNPSAGGAWERMVRCVKRVLEITLKEKVPQVETLQSLLIEAENLVNSRPLTHLPLESTDAEPLTPNHFLVGCPNYIQTPAVGEKINLRKQWQILQQLKQSFWRRWVLEYLPTLTRRSKWCELRFEHQPDIYVDPRRSLQYST